MLKLFGKLVKIRFSMSHATKIMVAFVIVIFRPLISYISTFFFFSKKIKYFEKKNKIFRKKIKYFEKKNISRKKYFEKK